MSINTDSELTTDIYFNRVLDSLYDNAKNIVKGYDYSDRNMTKILIELMKLVETEKSLSGLGKKFLVLNLLEKLINDSEEENKQELKILVHSILPGVIDTIIDVDKGILSINKNINKQSKNLFCCM